MTSSPTASQQPPLSASHTTSPARRTATVAIALVIFHILASTLYQPAPPTMSWFQKEFTLPSRSRGSYLITDVIEKEVPAIGDYKIGLLHLFIKHTSCALSLNENWDSDVRVDMSAAMDRIAPAAGPNGEELYEHNAEGPDDMPVSTGHWSCNTE